MYEYEGSYELQIKNELFKSCYNYFQCQRRRHHHYHYKTLVGLSIIVQTQPVY